MAMMMAKLYAALRAGDVPEAEAREAAEEAAAVDDRLDRIDRGLDGVRAEVVNLRTELKGEIALLRSDTKGEIRRLEWLLTGLLAVAVAVGGKYFLHG